MSNRRAISDQPSPAIRWVTEFTGERGSVRCAQEGGKPCFLLDSGASPQSPEETHASLVLSAEPMNLKRLVVTMRTMRQTRLDNPNPWECGWLVFSAAGPRNFCYLIPKPNGIEVGWTDHDKQNFVYTRGEPSFPVGSELMVVLRWREKFLDMSLHSAREYTSFAVPLFDPLWAGHSPSGGRVGCYCEDSVAEFTLEEMELASSA